ncbi:MAG: helix-turn-helix transcriptional regulator [Betaproteobacteria bacterium]|nr:helix-turn-helix transcriptional regulator [Betaproteobacteria bacterium]
MNNTSNSTTDNTTDLATAAPADVAIPSPAEMAASVSALPPAIKPQVPKSNVKLSAQEMQILRLLAEGRSSKEIAEALAITDKSCRTYLSRCYRTLGVNNGKHAVAWLLTHHLEQPTPNVGQVSTTYNWYLQCLGKGYFDAAIAHWQLASGDERPDEVRYLVVLMLLLKSQKDEALKVATRLMGDQLRVTQLFEQWFISRDRDSGQNLQDMVQALPVWDNLRYATLLALYQGGTILRQPSVVMHAATALYDDAFKIRQSMQPTAKTV